MSTAQSQLRALLDTVAPHRVHVIAVAQMNPGKLWDAEQKQVVALEEAK